MTPSLVLCYLLGAENLSRSAASIHPVPTAGRHPRLPLRTSCSHCLRTMAHLHSAPVEGPPNCAALSLSCCHVYGTHSHCLLSGQPHPWACASHASTFQHLFEVYEQKSNLFSDVHSAWVDKPALLAGGLNGDDQGYPIGKGADIFISVWNLHHSPYLWKDPEAFRPERFSEVFTNQDFKGAWAGFTPDEKAMYPNEVMSDFAFIPFGGGVRKCVGDQFAMMEATVAMAMILRRFTLRFVGSPEEVGMATGATIHTANGLNVVVTRRKISTNATGAIDESPAPAVSTA
mmetsp:Transcript_1145/g.3368  ORF Transcript_1145/g.3368 Transcript_1145/m.3368 type:complete len:288 (+) Transcript_1145:1604-2467(+)